MITHVILRSEATKDRFRAKAVTLPRRKAILRFAQDDRRIFRMTTFARLYFSLANIALNSATTIGHVDVLGAMSSKCPDSGASTSFTRRSPACWA